VVVALMISVSMDWLFSFLAQRAVDNCINEIRPLRVIIKKTESDNSPVFENEPELKQPKVERGSGFPSSTVLESSLKLLRVDTEPSGKNDSSSDRVVLVD
jgi:hypothetical protein